MFALIINGVYLPPQSVEMKTFIADMQKTVSLVREIGISLEEVAISISPKKVNDEIVVFVYVKDMPNLATNTLNKVGQKVGQRLKMYHYPKSHVTVYIQDCDPRLCWSSE